MVKVSAAAVPEDMAGVAWMLQVTSIQCLVHDGADAIPGYAAQKVPIRRRKYQRRENAVPFYLVVGGDGLQIFLNKLEGFLAGIDGLHMPLGSLATDHDSLGLPVDIFNASPVNLDVPQAFNSHQIKDNLPWAWILNSSMALWKK